MAGPRSVTSVAAQVMRAVTAAFLVSSAGFSFAGSRERWGGACGDWESPACLAMQDHTYDYLVPSGSWTPVGDAAQFGAAAYLLLAIATLALPSLLFRGRLLVTLAIGASTAFSILVFARITWESSVSGRPAEATGLLAAGLWWSVAWPLALLCLALLRRDSGQRPGRAWRAVVLAALLLATPVAQVLYAVGPYDAAPWYEAVAGGFVLLAGCALWPATARGRDAATSSAPGSIPAPLAAT